MSLLTPAPTIFQTRANAKLSSDYEYAEVRFRYGRLALTDLERRQFVDQVSWFGPLKETL
jgi:hypothetical protein